MTPRPQPRRPGASRLRNLLDDWIEYLYDKLQPPHKNSAAIYDWNGTCKYCGQKKNE